MTLPLHHKSCGSKSSCMVTKNRMSESGVKFGNILPKAKRAKVFTMTKTVNTMTTESKNPCAVKIYLPGKEIRRLKVIPGETSLNDFCRLLKSSHNNNSNNNHYECEHGYDDDNDNDNESRYQMKNNTDIIFERLSRIREERSTFKIRYLNHQCKDWVRIYSEQQWQQVLMRYIHKRETMSNADRYLRLFVSQSRSASQQQQQQQQTQEFTYSLYNNNKKKNRRNSSVEYGSVHSEQSPALNLRRWPSLSENHDTAQEDHKGKNIPSLRIDTSMGRKRRHSVAICLENHSSKDCKHDNGEVSLSSNTTSRADKTRQEMSYDCMSHLDIPSRISPCTDAIRLERLCSSSSLSATTAAASASASRRFLLDRHAQRSPISA